jgi:hypothetical protein
VTRRRVVIVVAAVLVLALGAVVRNQIKVHRGRLARVAAMQRLHPARPVPPAVATYRQALFEKLQPVAITNCELERFGERNDGGYLMCGNLLTGVQAAYSYGISGYDGWGCEISKHADVRVHQYDCFNTSRPWCVGGDTVFHEECVAGTPSTIDGRPFDTVQSQFSRNGDAAKRIVLKIDVEGAEWDTILAMPDAALQQIDQMAVEFHWDEDDALGWAHDERYLRAVDRLRQFFEVGHIHYNNASCIGDLAPFPSYAYEVLFVSKRLAVVDRSRAASGLHPEDAKNNWALPDCQAGAASGPRGPEAARMR